ncbi:hypothetical protein [Micromonospora sp. NPDC049282]|uniref:hypothetical protein n=1 Tax=Micromonospora sp. NPDC049282 TaxID=3364269 RepID=UPI00371A5D39
MTGHAVGEVLEALRPLLVGVDRAVARLTPEQAEATAAFLREVADVMRDYMATAPDEPKPARRTGADGG